jgi:AcrR family transcriptional regulator
MPPEQVSENHRERLFGAMVASVSERGYAATRIGDLVETAGLSRNSFYALYPDKEACFVATIKALIAAVAAYTGAPQAPHNDVTRSWDQRLHSGIDEFAQAVVAQPAAARMLLLEAPAAGPAALEPLEKALSGLERVVLTNLEESPDTAVMPPEMISACVGCGWEIVRRRVREGKESELPTVLFDFVEIALSYRPPPEPLRLTTRPPTFARETIDAHDRGERALRAFAAVAAEEGYANTTVNKVVKRASMSPTTFYAHFDGKEDAMMAAIESAAAQIAAAVLPAFRRNLDWPQAVRAACGALLNFLASRPALARLLVVEVDAAGSKAVERREEALRPLGALLTQARARAPQVSSLTIEAIAAGILALANKQIRTSGAESLPGLAPICTYMALAPFIGAEAACAAANGDGQARGARERKDLVRAMALRPIGQRALAVLEVRAASATELAEELGEPLAKVRDELLELQRSGMVEFLDGDGGGEKAEAVYRAMGIGPTFESEWSQLSQAERETISAEIRRQISADIRRAVEGHTFDARTDRHLIRIPLLVDERGWRELTDVHIAAMEETLAIQAKSSERLKRAGERGIHGRSVILMFELPPE